MMIKLLILAIYLFAFYGMWCAYTTIYNRMDDVLEHIPRGYIIISFIGTISTIVVFTVPHIHLP